MTTDDSGAGDAPASTGGPSWTAEQAADYFTQSGVPMSARTLQVFIRELGIEPAGRAPSPPQGGVGKALYPVAELMRLNAALAPWLVPKTPRRADPGR